MGILTGISIPNSNAGRVRHAQVTRVVATVCLLFPDIGSLRRIHYHVLHWLAKVDKLQDEEGHVRIYPVFHGFLSVWFRTRYQTRIDLLAPLELQ